MNSKKFKFGIMLNGLYMNPWQIRVYENILKTGLAECTLLIIKQVEPTPKSSLLQKIFAPHLLFEQYKKAFLNTTLYRPTYFEPLHLIDKIEVSTIPSGRSGEEINASDIETIQSHGLDFILRFGFGILKGDILQSAKWGIWSFHHGDEQFYRGGPPGFWELMQGENLQGTILQQLGDKLDAGNILLKRQYALISHSYVENVSKLLLESADMPAQALRLISNGSVQMDSLNPIKTEAPIYKYPRNFTFLRFLLKMGFNKIKFARMKLFKQENWIVGYRQSPENNYQYIAPNRSGEYYADPFVFIDSERPYIVAEHYSYRTRKGTIVMIHPGSNQMRTILEKDTHLSYPYIFQEDGKTYMMPEEANSGQLNLYIWNPTFKAFDFYRTILNKPAVDASILKHKGYYYLFLGLKGQLPNEKLMIYYSDKLEGPYEPHLANPVKVNPQGSRMAGCFFEIGDSIIRPSQCSVKYYGEKVIFHKIIQLTPTSYQEEYYDELSPSKEAPFNCGLHTYHKNANFEVIDLKTMKSSWVAFKAQL